MNEKESNEDFLKKVNEKFDKKFLSIDDIKSGDLYIVTTLLGAGGIFCTISNKDSLPKNVYKHFSDIKNGAMPKEYKGIKACDYPCYIFKMDKSDLNEKMIQLGKELLKTDD